jgi:hypothetical protein
MKPEQRDWFGWSGSRWKCIAEPLRPPEIVGEIDNPVLEAVRRFWWRAVDRILSCFVSLRLSLFDRIHGPEPVTTADLQRETREVLRSQKRSRAGFSSG